jgi:hypothetical protein
LAPTVVQAAGCGISASPFSNRLFTDKNH